MNANKANLILLTTFTFIFLGLVNLFIKAVPLTLANAIYFCQKTFSTPTVMLPRSILFILLLSLITIFLVSLLRFTFQVINTRLFIKRTLKEKVRPSSKLKTVISDLSLIGKVDIVKDERSFSFSYGFIHPRICLSQGFINTLSKKELKTVLIHEKYHVKNHDPLKIIIGKTVCSMIFFIPILKDIQAHYSFSKEVSADQMAIDDGLKDSLISAIRKLLYPDKFAVYGIAAFASESDLERRILYLTNKQKGMPTKVNKINLSISVGVLLLLLGAVIAPVHAIAMGGSMPSTNQSYFVCPFGGDCLNTCKRDLKENSATPHQSLQYSPVK